MTAFILLDEVTEKNGAIRVIPKSHQELVHVKSVSDSITKRTKEDNDILLMIKNKKNRVKIKRVPESKKLIFLKEKL